MNKEEETIKMLMEQIIYFNGNEIYKFKCPKYHSKMWVFNWEEDIEPIETLFCGCKVIQEVIQDYNLVLYYLDEKLDYWNFKKCYFSKKEMEEERQRRLDRKYL